MKRFGRNFAIYLLIFVFVLGAAYFYRGSESTKQVQEMQFSEFVSHLETGKYEKINITDRKLTGTKPSGDIEFAYAPSLLEIDWVEQQYVYPMLKEHKIKLESD
ncbi:MAG: ATP-dependent metallopeptidase FtsH/Yme1/Tma family protein, partial [Mogibacterium sp.]|nr:ATP-dependent metallopeptidase FtsH/Yme1/Tma family protein [Mogibacterium sp.]